MTDDDRPRAPTPTGGGDAADAPPLRFRSSTVARLLGMPVATLRVWEQRYRVCGADTSPGGHRLYGADDVERLRRLRALTRGGHAISTIARLDLAALEALLRLQPAAGGPARIGVVGSALAQRLRHWRPSLVPVAVHADLAGWTASPPAGADAVLVGTPTLDDGSWAALRALRLPPGARLGVAYRFATTRVLRDAEALGVLLLREPADAPQLERWLQACTAPPPPAPAEPPAAPPAIAPPRFTEAELSRLAAFAPSAACECPRHVAELALQLAHFEAYSARCVDVHPADAALHRALHEAAAQARAAIEGAVARVIAHEGGHA